MVYQEENLPRKLSLYHNGIYLFCQQSCRLHHLLVSYICEYFWYKNLVVKGLNYKISRYSNISWIQERNSPLKQISSRAKKSNITTQPRLTSMKRMKTQAIGRRCSLERQLSSRVMMAGTPCRHSSLRSLSPVFQLWKTELIC